ncbi:hypothetical protein GCM10008066_01580 [Oxalicibacterium faecigallinarum]|uniref:Uncharacterized protein n=1 Tax=Oxalicibacterium faecigallinarum TaxID=573741 RepID=A0A8J3AS99_9BURK|nr:hypothetical protein GCM10008066_01580 [Oxalicibacterium faecigallinarum]
MQFNYDNLTYLTIVKTGSLLPREAVFIRFLHIDIEKASLSTGNRLINVTNDFLTTTENP